jgi:hypothetical protein
VKSQIFALNRDFRKLNADTVKIPESFKALAADCGIEFQLATVDQKAGQPPASFINTHLSPNGEWMTKSSFLQRWVTTVGTPGAI